MPRSHNKKRNVGIIYELLLRRVSNSLVEGDMKKAQESLDIISRRFKKGTELYREFRIFKALYKSHASSERVAKRMLEESREVACKSDSKKLHKEISDLIREINYTFNDRSFYTSFLPEYKRLATIQTLLNDWREPGNYNIERVAKYESNVIESILENNSAKSSKLPDHSDPDVDSLVVKIMSEKINKRYSDVFNSDQKKILKLYAFSNESENIENLREFLHEVKDKSIKSISSLESFENNKTVLSKIENVRNRIISESVDNIDDQKITKFLTLIDLCNEIKESVNCQTK